LERNRAVEAETGLHVQSVTMVMINEGVRRELTMYRLQQHAKNEGKVVRMMPALSNEARPSQQ
jgi:hypothetical protein